jgi:hypothetical protein
MTTEGTTVVSKLPREKIPPQEVISAEVAPVPPRNHLSSAKETTDAEAGGILSKRLSEAELMLAHAAEMGKDLNPDLVGTIASARDAYAHDRWTTDLTKQFWTAYSQLCAAIKPVTGDSLAACAGKGPAKTLAWYRTGTLYLAFLILPLSVIMFINTSISNEMSDRIKDNDALAVTLRDQLLTMPSPAARLDQPVQTPGSQPVLERPRNERDIVTALQQFATANRFLYGRAMLLNHFILNAEHDPPFARSDDGKDVALELPVRLDDIPAAGFDKIRTYQEIRAYSKNVQQMNLMIYGAITAYFLPILYALLGACAYALRSISEQTTARTYTPSSADFARIIIAVIAGLVVGLFNNFTQGISLSPLAIAFLVGYAVEVFFSFLDAFLQTLKKVRS